MYTNNSHFIYFDKIFHIFVTYSKFTSNNFRFSEMPVKPFLKIYVWESKFILLKNQFYGLLLSQVRFSHTFSKFLCNYNVKSELLHSMNELKSLILFPRFCSVMVEWILIIAFDESQGFGNAQTRILIERTTNRNLKFL